jgi:hypothetical protein
MCKGTRQNAWPGLTKLDEVMAVGRRMGDKMGCREAGSGGSGPGSQYARVAGQAFILYCGFAAYFPLGCALEWMSVL